MRQRWSRILLSIAAALVLALSLTGVGIEVASSRLEGNITAIDISTTTGREHTPIQVVDDEGNYQAVNILLMGSDLSWLNQAGQRISAIRREIVQ